MLDKLRAQIIDFLAAHSECTISAAGPDGPEALPVPCRSVGLTVECLLPRWTDVVYHLEQEPRAALLFHDAGVRCWLRCWGAAQAVEQPDWTLWQAGVSPGLLPDALDALYRIVRITPSRIELNDKSLGWGVRQTLDL